jgi:hypothetical protein
MIPSVAIHYDPRLIEEAVFQAQRDSYVARDLDEARSRIYEVADPDERESQFSALNRLWFDRLGLARIVETAVGEQAIVAKTICRCFVLRATHRTEEGAELFVAPGNEPNGAAQRTVRLLLRPEALFEGEAVVAFLRHEFFHIADMLDPAFAYQPALPKADGGPTYDTLIINRYRVLWDITINGRMALRGWLKDSGRAQELNNFRQAFPMLGEQAENCFRRFFDAEQPRHADLAAFALDPRAGAGPSRGQSTTGTHCPLCKFPSHSFAAEPEMLGAEVLSAIGRDFPQWTPAHGLCVQCADLYRANRLSMAAAQLLPGWNPRRDDEPTLESHNFIDRMSR